MSESKRSHRHAEPSPDTIPESEAAYWKTVHHHWWFWCGLTLMLVAMAIYILSDNLTFLPHG